MPIEIRELIIKTTIVEKDEGSLHEDSRKHSKKDLEKIKKEILDLCDERITRFLNKRKER